MVVASALICMSLNIYHEARGEALLGQRAVALVTMNRAGGDPGKVCEVVFKDRQFSWANGKVTPMGGWAWKLDIEKPADREAWHRAKAHARLAIEGRLFDFTGGATHYHANYVRPQWAHSLKQVWKVGQHIFYRESDKSRLTLYSRQEAKG